MQSPIKIDTLLNHLFFNANILNTLRKTTNRYKNSNIEFANQFYRKQLFYKFTVYWLLKTAES